MTAPYAPSRPLERPGLVEPRLGSRELFPDLEFRAYLGHAAISPAHLGVSAAALACVEEISRGGARAFPIWQAQRDRLRASLAQLLGASEDEIALVPGTTRGVTDLALAIDWRPGDVLLTFEGEFPANVTPWQRASVGFGVEVRFLSAPRPTEPDASARILEEVERELARGARYLAVSAVQFQTGFRMPLAELGRLCRRFDARFIVDAIQGCGVTPLHVGEMGIDALSSGAHKWLLGLEGAGFLYVRSDFLAELRPLTAGWLSHEEGDHFLFRGAGFLRRDRPLKRTARVFEGSSENAVGFAALEAGLDTCLALGPTNIFEHVQSYLDAMEPEWEKRGFRSLRSRREEERSCILSLQLPDHVQLPALVRALRARAIMVSSPDGLVRLAPHFSNHQDEIPLVLQELDEALAELSSV